MAAKRKQIKRDPHRLNEPAARIAGGSRRSSVVVRGAVLARIRDRERLYEVLLQHDPDGPQPQFSAGDMSLLRQIAREGPLTNHVPAIRRGAIVMLGTLVTPENLDVLAELAVAGEDFYVRSHALLALGGTGLKLAVPLLRDALRAEQPTERQAAEAGLRMLSRRAGPGVLHALRDNERDESTRAALDRILTSVSGQRPDRPAPRETARRARQTTD